MLKVMAILIPAGPAKMRELSNLRKVHEILFSLQFAESFQEINEPEIVLSITLGPVTVALTVTLTRLLTLG